jgi:murein L,D-transpeptidase YafK
VPLIKDAFNSRSGSEWWVHGNVQSDHAHAFNPYLCSVS